MNPYHQLYLFIKIGIRFLATNLIIFVKDGKKYDLLPLISTYLSKMGIYTICCRQFVLIYQRWQEIRFIISNLRLIQRWKEE